jgi:hypothetical protein
MPQLGTQATLTATATTIPSTTTTTTTTSTTTTTTTTTASASTSLAAPWSSAGNRGAIDVSNAILHIRDIMHCLQELVLNNPLTDTILIEMTTVNLPVFYIDALTQLQFTAIEIIRAVCTHKL